MSRADGDFLARWSARKQKARTEPETETGPETGPGPQPAREPAPPAPVASDLPEPGAGRTDEEILQELGLPDPDSLAKGDSIAGFLRAGVPARLRNRALKRLWLTDPVFANLDGLNDYEEDFTDAATVVKDMKTAYRVGRGFLPDEPAEAVSEVAAGEAGPEDVAAAGDGGVADAAADPEEDGGAAGASDAPAEGQEQEAAYADAGSAEPGEADGAEPAEEPLAPLRRMRFRFDAG